MRPNSRAALQALIKAHGAKPKRRRSRSNESPRVTAILEALTLKGYWAWRANSGNHIIAAQGGHARAVVKGAPAGTPDILVVVPRDVLVPEQGRVALSAHTIGMLGGLEVKTETGKQRLSQKKWEAKAKRHGVPYALVTTPGQALDTVARWARSGA